MSSPAYAYRAYGLHVRSDVPLPFDPLPEPASIDTSEPPDVTVRRGAVPETLPAGPGHPIRSPLWQARPGAFLMHEGTVRFLVTGGRDVLIDPLGGDADDVAAFFIGSPFTALLQQRAVLTLHAAAVATEAGAVLLLGTSGSGKSSLAMALGERGYPLLADDVTGVVLDTGQRPVALPAFARQRLWAHTLDKMRWRGRAHSPVRRGLDKYWVPAQRFCSSPLPVRAAFVLESSHLQPGIGIEPLPPGSAFWAVWEATHRKRAMDAMGRRPAHFRTATVMARRVPVARVTRSGYPFLLESLAERIEAYLREAGPAGRGKARGVGASGEAGPFSLRSEPDSAGEGTAGEAALHRPPAMSPRPNVTPASRPGIVWLASYPKSGNTWLRAVLTNYLREDGEPASINALVGVPYNGREVFNEYLGLDSADMTDDEIARLLPRFREVLAERISAQPPLERGLLPEQRLRRNQPGFAKTHEAYRLPGAPARFPRTGGVVYLVRNPLDVAVSYAHHLNWSLDRIIRLMDDPAAHESSIPGGIFDRLPEPMTTWSGHVAGWTEQTDLPLHVARYEDLLADPQAGFGKIVRFACLAWDEARLNRAIDHSAFHRLQAQEAESGFTEKQPTAPTFFRAGMAGSWRTALTPTQVRAIVEAHGEAMTRFGYLQEAEAFLRAGGRGE